MKATYKLVTCKIMVGKLKARDHLKDLISWEVNIEIDLKRNVL